MEETARGGGRHGEDLSTEDDSGSSSEESDNLQLGLWDVSPKVCSHTVHLDQEYKNAKSASSRRRHCRNTRLLHFPGHTQFGKCRKGENEKKQGKEASSTEAQECICQAHSSTRGLDADPSRLKNGH